MVRKQRAVPWVVVLLGFWLGGCYMLPVGPELPEERQAALSDTRAEVPGDGLHAAWDTHRCFTLNSDSGT